MQQEQRHEYEADDFLVLATYEVHAAAQRSRQISRWPVRGCQLDFHVDHGHHRCSQCFWPCHMVGTEQ